MTVAAVSTSYLISSTEQIHYAGSGEKHKRGTKPYTEEQSIVIGWAGEAQKAKGIEQGDAEALRDLANEVGLIGRIDEGHEDGKNEVTQQPHLRIGQKNHIPIKKIIYTKY